MILWPHLCSLKTENFAAIYDDLQGKLEQVSVTDELLAGMIIDNVSSIYLCLANSVGLIIKRLFVPSFSWCHLACLV